MTSLRFLRRLAAVLAVLSLAVALVATVLRWRGARELDRAVADFEARVGPITTEAYNLPPVPPETNPAPPFRRAAERFGDDLRGRGDAQQPLSVLLRQVARRPVAEWSADEAAEVERAFDLLRPARAELQEALDRRGPSSFQLEFDHAWDMDLPNLLAVNSLGDLLMLEALQAEQRGDWAAVLRGAEDLGHLAAVLRREVPLIFQYLGLNFERRQHRVLRQLAEAPAVEREILEAAVKSLDGGVRVEDLVPTVGGEGAFLYQVTQTPQFRRKLAFSPLSHVYLWISGDHDVAGWLRYYADSTDILRAHPYAEATWPSPPEQGRYWSADLEGFTLLFPPLSARLAATRSTAQLARAALALRLEGLASGRYPTLADTAPSELTGKPIRRQDGPDGSVTLDLEGATELWDKVMPRTPAAPSILAAEWHLPPPDRPPRPLPE